jgi:transposase
MTATPQRQTLLPLIGQAVSNGARLHKAFSEIGLSSRTVQRWLHPTAQAGDARLTTLRTKVTPPNRLSATEREAAMQVLNSDEFKDLPPSQIVPRLADAGRYVASESTMYRLLHASAQMAHRRLERVPSKVSKPRALVATKPHQVFCWDITYLPAPVRGMHYYLLMLRSHL